MRIADPKPGFCSACFGAHPDRRYIDFEADYDGAPVLDRETRTIAVVPWSGQLGGHDNLYLCEACVDEAREKLALDARSETVQKQFVEIRKRELQAEHWRDTAKRKDEEIVRLEGFIAQLEAALDAGGSRPRRNRRAA